VRYEDFTILFTASDNRYKVRVLDSPGGQGMGDFELPFDVSDNAGLPVNYSDRRSMEECGTQLFDALFKGEVADLFHHTLGYVAARPECGVRLKIRINPKEVGLAGIHNLPWELLYRKETRTFLALDRRTSIVRYLDVPRPAEAMLLPSTLKVLVATPLPKGTPELEILRERKNIRSALQQSRNSFEVSTLRPATADNLRAKLAGQSYHILHFSGHAVGSDGEREASLFFENQRREISCINAEYLGSILAGSSSLRLVFLNSCDSAAISRQDIFSGIASFLVLCGVPAVVANRFPIFDDAAIAFSRHFYNALSRGKSLDEALTEGRIAIRHEAGVEEWGIPALFSRLPANQIFTKSDHDQGEDLGSAVYRRGSASVSEETETPAGGRKRRPRKAVAEATERPLIEGVREELVQLAQRDEAINQHSRQRKIVQPGSNESLRIEFDFPKEVRTSCKQYLVYFSEFLRDLGVNVQSEIADSAGRTLLAVSPLDSRDALNRIAEALHLYLRLPGNPVATVGATNDIPQQKLAANVDHLRSQLRLAYALVQAQQTTIQSQEQIISGEIVAEAVTAEDKVELFGNIVALTKYEGAGFQINIPEIFRRVAALFGRSSRSGGEHR